MLLKVAVFLLCLAGPECWPLAGLLVLSAILRKRSAVPESLD